MAPGRRPLSLIFFCFWLVVVATRATLQGLGFRFTVVWGIGLGLGATLT